GRREERESEYGPAPVHDPVPRRAVVADQEAEDEEQEVVEEVCGVIDDVLRARRDRPEEREGQPEGDRGEQDPGAAERSAERGPDPVAGLAAEPEEEGERDERVAEEIEDEPEVMPARVPGRVRAECEDARVEIEVGSERLALDQPLDVDLGRYDDEDAEDERDEEPLPALAEVLAGQAVAEREAGPDPGDQEEERHPETREEVVELEEERARLRVFDVPPPLGHEE